MTSSESAKVILLSDWSRSVVKKLLDRIYQSLTSSTLEIHDLDQSLVEALEIVQPGEHLLDVEEYKYKPEKPFKIKTEFEEAHDDSQVSPLGQSLESDAFQTLPQKPQSRRRKAVSSSTRHTAKRPRKKDLPLADTKNDDGFLPSIRKSFQDRSPMLLERVSLSPMLLNPQDLDSKKETLSRLKISPFRTLVGLSYKDASSSSSEDCNVLRGRALAWSDPQADDDIKKQFETVTKVMQDLYGFSDADLFYRNIYGLRQGFQSRNYLHSLKRSLLTKHGKRPGSEIRDLLSQEDILRVMKESKPKSSDSCALKGIRDLAEEFREFQIQLDPDLGLEEIDAIFLVAWSKEDGVRELKDREQEGSSTNGKNQQESLNIECFKIWGCKLDILQNEHKAGSDLCVNLLFNVWCTSSSKIPACPAMLNKFKKVAELVLIPKTAREFLEKELRHERQCPYCGEMFGYLTFDQRNKYNYHLKLHRLDGHQCDCDLQFKDQSAKRKHVMLEHSNGKYVKCAQCYFINTRPVVSRHMQEDHQHYVCDICGAVSKNKGTYYSHRRYHKTYKCGHCDQVFTGHKTLKSHIAESHPDPKCVTTWPCGDCTASFRKKSSLSDHRRRMHVADGAKKHKCGYCGKGFIKKTPLDVHVMSVHIKSRPHSCRFNCGANFNSTGNRSIHERAIHGELYDPLKAGLKNPPQLK